MQDQQIVKINTEAGSVESDWSVVRAGKHSATRTVAHVLIL